MAKYFFDCVIDNFSVYANTNKVIKKLILRFIEFKKKWLFFFKGLEHKTLGSKWKKIEKGTYNQIKFGPCKNMGISFF